ncbi:MAG: hypothetical protein AMXMBFR74_29890 [Parvibaculum sp.]
MRVIHVFAEDALKKDVDGPDKPGHDGIGWRVNYPSSHNMTGMVIAARMVEPVMRLAIRVASPPSWRARM